MKSTNMQTLHIGFDDTDSRKGMCTTYLAYKIVNDLLDQYNKDTNQRLSMIIAKYKMNEYTQTTATSFTLPPPQLVRQTNDVPVKTSETSADTNVILTHLTDMVVNGVELKLNCIKK